jgi:pimeloyl-ACP methyl ester carboxylesterase
MWTMACATREASACWPLIARWKPQIYNTLPDNLDRLIRRHPLKCPVAFIGGIQSLEMQQVGMGMTEKLVKGRVMMLDGSHLFPMEKPLATAAAIEASLRGFEAR